MTTLRIRLQYGDRGTLEADFEVPDAHVWDTLDAWHRYHGRPETPEERIAYQRALEMARTKPNEKG